MQYSQAQMQHTFDTVVKALRLQNCKSTTFLGQCMYKNQDGTKCAAGPLIPPSEYLSQMEHCGVCVDVFGATLVRDCLLRNNHCPTLAHMLQRVHDTVAVSKWEDGFLAIAEAMGFSMPDHEMIEEEKTVPVYLDVETKCCTTLSMNGHVIGTIESLGSK